MNKLVSIIIPAFNESKVIAKNLESLTKQTYKPLEIIVVDDSSTDETAQLALIYTPNVYTRPHAERSIQRNFGAKQSKGSYLLFMDADMELSPNVISECVKSISNEKNVAAVVIPEQPVAKNFWEKAKALERELYNLSGDTITDAARFFERSAFFSAGGYDETLTGPEDWDLPETLKERGFKISRISAKLFHFERISSPIKLARKKFYYALTSHRYFKKHKLSSVSSKTIYLFRPVFYRHWKKLISQPDIFLGMLIILFLEQIFGGLGFIYGKIKNS